MPDSPLNSQRKYLIFVSVSHQTGIDTMSMEIDYSGGYGREGWACSHFLIRGKSFSFLFSKTIFFIQILTLYIILSLMSMWLTHCYREYIEEQSWTHTHRRCRSTRTYLHQLSADTGYNLEDQLGAMNDKYGWREREREREKS